MKIFVEERFRSLWSGPTLKFIQNIFDFFSISVIIGPHEILNAERWWVGEDFRHINNFEQTDALFLAHLRHQETAIGF